MGRTKRAARPFFVGVIFDYLNMFMTHKLLVVTFEDDLAQFEMFCYCLIKNWQGQKNLIVVFGKNTNNQTVQDIIDRVFSNEWTVEIKPTAYPTEIGWHEQQINKVVYSVNSSADDVIVFDSKDFMLKPCDLSTFKPDNRYRITYYLPGKLVDVEPDVRQLVDKTVDHLPNLSNLTPWIWNVNHLTKFWEYLNNRFNSYTTWKRFPGTSEWIAYYVFAWTDNTSGIPWHRNPKKMPLLISGGWAEQSYEQMLEQAKHFDQNANCVIWKHNRRLPDLRSLDVTKSVLSKYGIEQHVIDRVFDNYQPATRPWG
jgi:hypothetical protein